MDELKFASDIAFTKKSLAFYCEEGSLSPLKAILNKTPELVNEPNNQGLTPLFIAIKNSNYEIASYLKLKGGDVNTRNKSGQTPLFWVAANNNLEGVQCLLELGANVNSYDNVKYL